MRTRSSRNKQTEASEHNASSAAPIEPSSSKSNAEDAADTVTTAGGNDKARKQTSVPRGIPLGGRFWKSPLPHRNSAMKQRKPQGKGPSAAFLIRKRKEAALRETAQMQSAIDEQVK